MQTLPQPVDEWSTSARRARDDANRAYYRGRSGRWWEREYERAGVLTRQRRWTPASDELNESNETDARLADADGAGVA